VRKRTARGVCTQRCGEQTTDTNDYYYSVVSCCLSALLRHSIRCSSSKGLRRKPNAPACIQHFDPYRLERGLADAVIFDRELAGLADRPDLECRNVALVGVRRRGRVVAAFGVLCVDLGACGYKIPAPFRRLRSYRQDASLPRSRVHHEGDSSFAELRHSTFLFQMDRHRRHDTIHPSGDEYRLHRSRQLARGTWRMSSFLSSNPHMRYRTLTF
jgi:hypothetical protein